MRCRVLLVLVLILAACATGPRLRPPAAAVPDLRGTWTGTWGGTPLTLLVLDQEGTVPAGGIDIGPWSIGGDPLPAVSGTLTFTVRDAPVTVNVVGRLGDWHGGLTLVVDALTRNGEQLVLTHLTPDRLAGNGTAIPTWEPQGPVKLARTSN
jgi:hypothetical protein